jgi:hypothetical protein
MPRSRHRVTGRFLAFDCEVDCLEHCAGLCGAFNDGDEWAWPSLRDEPSTATAPTSDEKRGS